jgi:hypothetical protein
LRLEGKGGDLIQIFEIANGLEEMELDLKISGVIEDMRHNSLLNCNATT